MCDASGVLLRKRCQDSGNRADFVSIVDGKKIGERDLVPRHDAESRVRGPLIVIKAPPHANHHGEQKQSKRNAGNGEQTAPPVAKRRFATKPDSVMKMKIRRHGFYAPSSAGRDCPFRPSGAFQFRGLTMMSLFARSSVASAMPGSWSWALPPSPSSAAENPLGARSSP